MRNNSIRFKEIPKRCSIAKIFAEINRKLNIKVHEYKGIGFVKKEVNNEESYDLIVEFKKEYLFSKLMDEKFVWNNSYWFKVDRYEICYEKIGMKYLVCHINDGSIMKNKILKFETRHEQNVLDVINRVVDMSKFDVNYIISNKSSSYIALNKVDDAKELLKILKQQKYLVEYAKYYHDFSTFNLDGSSISSVNKRMTFGHHRVGFGQNSFKRKSFNLQVDNFKEKKQESEIKRLKKQLNATRSQINLMMDKIDNTKEAAPLIVKVNNDSMAYGHQATNARTIIPSFNPNIISPPNPIVGNWTTRMPFINHQLQAGTSMGLNNHQVIPNLSYPMEYNNQFLNPNNNNFPGNYNPYNL